MDAELFLHPINLLNCRREVSFIQLFLQDFLTFPCQFRWVHENPNFGVLIRGKRDVTLGIAEWHQPPHHYPQMAGVIPNFKSRRSHFGAREYQVSGIQVARREVIRFRWNRFHCGCRSESGLFFYVLVLHVYLSTACDAARTLAASRWVSTSL